MRAVTRFCTQIINNEGNFEAMLRMVMIKKAYARPDIAPAIMPRYSLLPDKLILSGDDPFNINHNPADERIMAIQADECIFSFNKNGAINATKIGAV